MVKKERKERPVLLEIYEWKDGTLEAFDGGTIPIKIGANGGFVFNGKDCDVVILDNGDVPVEKWQNGVKETLVTEDKNVDATEYIDTNRLEKLTDEEKDELSWIGYVELHKIVTDALEDDVAGFTPYQDAASQADQALNLPKQKYVLAPKYENRPGRTVIDFDVRLAIGDVDCSEYIQKALWSNADIGVSEGDVIAEQKYCGATDKRESARIFRFSIPKSYFK